MATEYAIFDLYHVFVELLFGHFLMAIIGITALLAVIAFLFRISLLLVTMISIMFLGIMIMGYTGSLGAIAMFLLSGTYFAYAIIRWIQGGRI